MSVQVYLYEHTTMWGCLSLTKEVRKTLLLWEDKHDSQAFLTDVQKDSIFNLNSQLLIKTFPEVLPLDDVPVLVCLDKNTQKVDNNYGIDLTSFKFLLLFAKLEEELDKFENESVKQYTSYLSDWDVHCNNFIEEANSCLELLTVLKTDFVKVATKTNLLHEACEVLLDEQSKCVQALESINSRIVIFNEYAKINQKISSPTFNVHLESFSSILYRIDECIDYLKAHEQFKESVFYLNKFKFCSSRCLSLIKSYIFEVLYNVTQQVLNSNLQQTATDDAFILLYGKFRTTAPKIKSHIEMIESQKQNRVEYAVLLNEIHQFYFSNRSSLLFPSISGAVKELADKHSKNLCYFIRSGCALMIHICEDEHNLFYNFFEDDSILLDEMLERLCMKLYDALRPLIIHVVHMESLTEICSIFKEEVLENQTQSQSEHQLKSFKKVCSQILQDVQERLVYRTNIYIKEEILCFHPSAGDLAYPEKLNMIKTIAQQNSKTVAKKSENDSIEDEDLNIPLSPADLHAMWYPTVKRALMVLSKLYRSVDKSIFQGLSQEVLSICVQSLISAENSISKNKSQLDSNLFFIKHLLILREQIIPFQIDNVVKETSIDFSKIKDAAVDLLKSRSNLFALNNNNALLQFLLEGTPSFYEKQFDCRKIVDDHLKKSCEEFIKNVTFLLAGSLQEFLNKVSIVSNKVTSISATSLKTQPFASPDNVKNIVSSAYRTLKQEQPLIRKLMSLYLANDDTEYILFKPIKTNILQTYHQLDMVLKEYYTENDIFLIAAPSIDQVNILMNCKMDPPKSVF